MADTNHRSLLYGVIAIQEGVIDADRFEKCLDSWIADPSSSLQDYFDSEFQLGDSDSRIIGQKLESLLVQIGDSETSINESIANSLSRYVQDDFLRAAVAKRADSLAEDSVAQVKSQKNGDRITIDFKLWIRMPREDWAKYSSPKTVSWTETWHSSRFDLSPSTIRN